MTEEDPEEKIKELVAMVDKLTGETVVLQQKLQKAREAKDKFVISVSHDLNTLLFTIQGMASLLFEKTWPESDARRYAETIINKVGDMREFLNYLAKIAKAGQIIGQKEKVGFRDLIYETTEQVTKGIGNVIAYDMDLPVVYVDKLRITEVLVNLASNSFKCGATEVKIGYDPKRGAFFVRDDGEGIDEQNLERVFLPGFRVNLEKPGSGMGLSIVRAIIEAHGGEIWIESQGKGKGTTVFFTLPIVSETNE